MPVRGFLISIINCDYKPGLESLHGVYSSVTARALVKLIIPWLLLGLEWIICQAKCISSSLKQFKLEMEKSQAVSTHWSRLGYKSVVV